MLKKNNYQKALGLNEPAKGFFFYAFKNARILRSAAFLILRGIFSHAYMPKFGRRCCNGPESKSRQEGRTQMSKRTTFLLYNLADNTNP